MTREEIDKLQGMWIACTVQGRPKYDFRIERVEICGEKAILYEKKHFFWIFPYMKKHEVAVWLLRDLVEGTGMMYLERLMMAFWLYRKNC